MKYLKTKTKWKKEVKRFFRATIKQFDLEPFEVEIFYGCCDNLNRFHIARDTLNEEGSTFKTKGGAIKKHPAVEIERQAWASFLSGMKRLKFDEVLNGKKKVGRPTVTM